MTLNILRDQNEGTDLIKLQTMNLEKYTAFL